MSTNIPAKTPKQARTEGFNAVAEGPYHAPRNPYDEDVHPEHYAAWDEGADEAGLTSRYTNGVLAL
jgi:hypothetical protein